MLQLVTDGLKMTPIDPSFTDARDAILDADCATNACANEDSIWGGFADRGLGYGAAARLPHRLRPHFSQPHGVHESFSLPYLDVVNPLTDVAIDDSAEQQQRRHRSGRGDQAHRHADQPVARREQGASRAPPPRSPPRRPA